MSSSATTPTPKRGGMHPIYGAFVGGGTMGKDYRLVNPRFRCVSQLRTVKQLLSTQNALEQARDNVSDIKFHGNLEIEESKHATELDKRTFIDKVDLLMKTYGFQNFFYLQGPDGTMQSLLTHPHLFTLEDVIKEHRKRDGDHLPILDDAGNETPESVLSGHSKYDDYELMDCSLSRLAVQSVIGRALQDDIKTRYSHLADFDLMPGNVYFFMALEASNASVALDIDDAVEKFASLSLASFPGENVKGLATEALRLIKIMEGGYCLPLKLGSDLLKKVCATSSEHFNRWIYAKLDEVRELEMKYKLKDPKLMVSDVLYSTLGPVALCGFLQEKYGSLITEKAWPAIATTHPSSNLTTISEVKVKRCYHCQSPDHLKNACPKLKNLGDTTHTGRGRGNRTSGVGGGTGNSNSDDTPTPGPTSDTAMNRKPMPAWRYIEPVDKTSAIVIGDLTYKWCSECRCRATGKKGFFTTTHFTAEHVNKNVGFDASVNHSALLNRREDQDVVPDRDVIEDDDLVFTGPWHCAIVDAEVDSADFPAAWMAAGTSADTVDIDFAAIVPSRNDDDASPGDDVSLSASSATSLLLVDTSYQNVFDTRPPLSIVDLQDTEFDRCDNPTCNYIGPVGFNCPKCSDGMYRTALVCCHHCHTGVGFLGDLCSHCESALYGRLILHSCLPGQHIASAIEHDPESPLSRNTIRMSFIRTSIGYYPPDINCAPCGLASGDLVELGSFLDCQEEESSGVVPNSIIPASVYSYDDCSSAASDVDDDGFFDCYGDDNDGFFDCITSNDDDGDDDGFFDCATEVVGGFSDSVGGYRDSATASWPMWFLQWPMHLASVALRSSISWMIDFPLTGCLNLVSSFMAESCFWAFFVSLVGWDTIEQFFLPAPRGSRSFRRRRNTPLKWFPRHWMILSSLMLLSGYRSLSPVWRMTQSIAGTYTRTRRMEELLCMNVTTVSDLHRQRFKLVKTLLYPELAGSLPSRVPSCKEAAVKSDHSRNEEDVFHDCRSDLPAESSGLTLELSAECPAYFINCAEYESDIGTDPTLPALNAAMTGLNFLDCLGPSKLERFPVIFDSGASVAISGNKGDFVGDTVPPFRELTLGGMAKGTRVEGIGLVHWTFHNGRETLTLALKCYYVPNCQVRLLSPQRLFNSSKGITGQFAVREDCSSLEIDNHPTLSLDYDSTSHLPIGLAYNGKRSPQDVPLSFLQVNLCVTDEENQNLTPAQKLLMMWHYKFGHCNMAKVQSILRLPIFTGDKYRSAARAELPKCATCCYAKAHRG
jgi:hypothetical protein